jgi:hypothetical protein
MDFAGPSVTDIFLSPGAASRCITPMPVKQSSPQLLIGIFSVPAETRSVPGDATPVTVIMNASPGNTSAGVSSACRAKAAEAAQRTVVNAAQEILILLEDCGRVLPRYKMYFAVHLVELDGDFDNSGCLSGGGII